METIINLTEFAFAIIFGFVVIILCRKVLSSAKNSDIDRKIVIRCAIITSVWFLLSLLLSINGFFHDPKQFSEGDFTGLILAIVIMFIPISGFFFLLKKNKSFKNLIDSVDRKFITGLQSYRMLGGIYWLLLLFDKRAPALFAIPTGILDSLIGISAPAIAYIILRATRFAKIWNYIGIFDFILAFSIYFLYFPFKILNISPEMIMWGGFYPVAFIVIFVVPLSVILHVVSLIKISNSELL